MKQQKCILHFKLFFTILLKNLILIFFIYIHTTELNKINNKKNLIAISLNTLSKH